MEPISLKILDSQYITHDVKRFVVEKPKDFVYAPGEAAILSIDEDEVRDIKRPYTFTSLNDWNYLEFIIKIYEERKGLTRYLPTLNAGGSFLMHKTMGTLRFRGKGIFLAGGTGITPFLAILRALYHSGNIEGNGLIYSNHAAEDIIMYQELKHMLGDNFINFFSKQGVIGFNERYIDRNFLIKSISDFDQQFYVCGPPGFVQNISDQLKSLGADAEAIAI